MITAIVPIRRFESGKTRLEGVLTSDDRSLLIQTMASQVINCLERASSIDQVMIVTKDPEVLEAYQSKKVKGVIEQPNDTLNSALNRAMDQLSCELPQGSNQQVLLIHGDLPLISMEAVDFFTKHQSDGIVINPCHLGLGTNALMMPLAKRIPLFFGERSFHKHLVNAKALGFATRIVSIYDIAMDMDTKSDWVTLQSFGVATDSMNLFDRLIITKDNG
ncbi:MAG: 2-phospho-L-lactate guanylyltransferase [Cellvibrionales bacterium]|nr:2-phospho-L-lactate guanylyltransferase [Cellvibrionales bacterium]